MLLKACTKCLEGKPDTSFAFKNKASGRRSPVCKSCHSEIRKSIYRENSTREISRVLERKREIRDKIRIIKDGLSCSRCPENHPSTLHFHHRNPADKEFNIAHAVARSFSIDRILREISKCEILCANCHSKEHWNR